MLDIVIVEERKSFVDVTYSINENSLSESELKRLRELIYKDDELSDDELSELYNFCNSKNTSIDVDDRHSEYEYEPSEFSHYTEF